MPPFDDVADWLETIDATPPGNWKAFPLKELDPLVRADSARWCRDHLSAEAYPFQPGLRSVVEGCPSAEGTATTPVLIDLLRHRFKVDDLDLELIEGRSFTMLRAEAPKTMEGSAKSRGEEIHRLARILLSKPWQFQLPGKIEEGVRFSSNPEVRPESMRSWEARADGGIRGGRLWFLCFRRSPGLVGFLNEMQWFPEAFRERLKT